MSLEVFNFCPRCAQPMQDRSLRDDSGIDLVRRACPDDACGFVQWGNPTPAVGALVEHEGRMILARGAGWPEGWFALITGYLEGKEDPKAGVVREVKEEIGLDVQEAHLIGNYIFERKNEIMLCYHAIATGTLRLGPEIVEVKYHAPHELKPWPRATGFAVADWMTSRGLAFEFLDFPGRPPDPKPATSPGTPK
ncbi:MAG: NUDIX domain-containing protein [Betaproteobacteria bacterium]|nr:NUDIX domain-containing protein [Betaproteobacteria bacterium]